MREREREREITTHKNMQSIAIANGMFRSSCNIHVLC